MFDVRCIDGNGNNLIIKNCIYTVHEEHGTMYLIEYGTGAKSWFDACRFEKLGGDVIKPEHYNKGEIDLYESWYLTRPFNEFRAIMESVAERYMKRDKLDRLEDLDKCMETLRRLREYEVRHKEENA